MKERVNTVNCQCGVKCIQNMRSIAFFVKTFEGGGAQRVMATLTKEFVAQGHRVTIITMFHAESYELPLGVELLNMDIDRADLSVEHNREKIDKARRLLQKNQVNVVVIGSTSAPLYQYALEMRKQCEFRIIAQMTNDPNSSPKSSEQREERDRIFDLLVQIGSGFVFQTPYERDYFPPSVRKKSIIINNPIMDLPFNPFSGERRKVIVTAGRLDEQKNFHLLLRAFAIFCESHPDYRLEIYGRGHMENSLRSEAVNLGISDLVDFCGFSLDWHKKLSNAAMFVQSSDYEGVSNVLLEALCMGVPTISTDCPAYGARMFLEHGKSGFLVEVGNAIAMASAMIELANNPKMGQNFSNQSVLIKDTLSVESIVRQYLDYWDYLDSLL